MARVTSVQRISKLLEIISKYYKTIYNLLCIIMMHAQKNTSMDLCVCLYETNEKAERKPLSADGAEATWNGSTAKGSV